MANHLIKMTVRDDLEPVPLDEQKWCLVDPAPFKDASRLLCSGEVLDTDTDAKWESKVVLRGGITCDHCMTNLKAYKTVKL